MITNEKGIRTGLTEIHIHRPLALNPYDQAGYGTQIEDNSTRATDLERHSQANTEDESI